MRVPAKDGRDGCLDAPALVSAEPTTPTEQVAMPPAALTFADVFATQAAYVLGLLGRLGVATADLEDVAQEVFIVIHQKLSGFERRSSLKTWVCGICLRKASDYRRRAHRRHERLVAEHDERPASGEHPEARVLRDESAAQLQRALAALPEPLMQVFVLYEIEELPMLEVARAIGCPRFTGYTRLRAARRALREQLAQPRAARSAR
ncbi:MAG TPA: sigma-70 family RNA polymerase sigma factor [Polyangiales bacterium]|nr:sigma-70 family RNA polymerase sigma factor [Polyangiales bacterium]